MDIEYRVHRPQTVPPGPWSLLVEHHNQQHGHQQLVERVRLLVEGEVRVEVWSRRLGFLPELLDLLKAVAREVLKIREVLSRLVTPFQDVPIGSRKRSRSWRQFLKAARVGSEWSSAIL